LIIRDAYLDELIGYREKQLIKVITGVRRCGKSTLMEQYRDYLINDGVSADQIIFINFDDLDFEHLSDYHSLYEYIKSKMTEKLMYYVFLDEVQKVDEFQKVASSLFIKKNIDIYISGSNAAMLSGELATLLSGRYIQIKMLPLSFREFAGAIDLNGTGRNYEWIFTEYLNRSSFPYALKLRDDAQRTTSYLASLYDTILLRDVASRKGQVNVSALDSLAKFMMSNIGNLTSVRNIAKGLSESGRTISPPTIESYLSGLSDAFLFYKAKRYDAKGKKHLQLNDKYYLVDVGLRNNILGETRKDTSHALENVIYLELLRRNFDVFVGKVDEYEIDFIAMRGNIPCYYQVSETVREQNTLERELRPFKMIRDNNPKYLLTMDAGNPVNINGIIQMNVIDFLLGQE
jgi:predicted AAA+ superfamily ATPase